VAKYFEVVKWREYNPDDTGKAWFRFQVETFSDNKIRRLKPVEKLGWVAILIAAKRDKNKVEWDARYVLHRAELAGNRIPLDLDYFASCGQRPARGQRISNQSATRQADEAEGREAAQEAPWCCGQCRRDGSREHP
jgi:hypothetical protein